MIIWDNELSLCLRWSLATDPEAAASCRAVLPCNTPAERDIGNNCSLYKATETLLHASQVVQKEACQTAELSRSSVSVVSPDHQ